MITSMIAITLIYLIAIALLLVFNEMVFRKLKPKSEVTRKFAHFTATLATLPFPWLFKNHWYVFSLGVVFFVILFISKSKKGLNSIHGIKRKSMGSYLLPVSIYLTFLFSSLQDQKILFVLPMLILAISDPVANVVGLSMKNGNPPIRLVGITLNKTWLGSLSFFISAFILSVVVIFYNRSFFDLKTFWLALAVALVTAFSEMISSRGLDNLTVPISASLVLFLFL